MTNTEDLKNFNIHNSAHINYDVTDKFLNPVKLGDNIIICSNAVIYKGNIIGDNCFIGHNAILRESNIIGNNIKIGSNVEIAFNVEISDNTNIHSNTFICENTKIGANVFIGPNVNFLNSKFPVQKNSKKLLKSPVICENVTIGGGVTLLPGVVIGKNTLIGAGSVITKDIPPNSIVYNSLITTIKKNDKTLRSK